MKLTMPIKQTGVVLDENGVLWKTYAHNKWSPRYWWNMLILGPLCEALWWLESRQ